jgi:hypothetical protein
MPLNEISRYDSITAALLGGWGPARSFAGIIGALAFGYLLIGYRDIFNEYAAGIPSRAGWVAFTGPLWFLTIPFVSYCLFCGVVREACQPITLLHLAALQGMNTSLNYGADISIPFALFGLLMVAFDFYVLAHLRDTAVISLPVRPTRLLIFFFGAVQAFFLAHFGWTEVQFITASITITFARILAFIIPTLSCAVLAAFALTSALTEKIKTEPNQ